MGVVLALAQGCEIAPAATVYGTLIDAAGNAGGNYLQFVPPAAQAFTWNGTNYTVTPYPVRCYVNTNNNFSTNLVGGYYKTYFDGTTSGLKPVLIVVPPDTNTYSFNDCARFATNLPPFLWTNSLILSLAPGSNILFWTNNTILTIASTAGGGGGGSSFVATPNQTNVLNYGVTNDAQSFTMKSAGGVQNTFTFNGVTLGLGNAGLAANNPVTAPQFVGGIFAGNGGGLTNIPASAITGSVTNVALAPGDSTIIVATNSASSWSVRVNTNALPSGTISLTPNQTNVLNYGVTNNGAATLSSLDISNSTYGSLIVQGNAGAKDAQLDTYQGQVRLFVPPANVGTAGGSLGVQMAAGYNYLSWMYGQTSLLLGVGQYDINSGKQNLTTIFPAQQDESTITGHGFGNTPVSTFGLHGGSGMALEDLPIHGNELNAAMSVPPIVLTSYSGPGFNTNEASCSNLLRQASLAGVMQAVTNAGGYMLFHMDDPALFWSPARTNDKLCINLDHYPSGTNFATVVHNFGCKYGGTTYYWPFATNSIYGNGQWVTNVPSSPYAPFTDLSHIQQDVRTFYDVGFDMIREADVSVAGTGPWLAASRAFAENILMPMDYIGVWQKQSYATSTNAGFPGVGRLTPMALEAFTDGVGDGPAQIIPNCNIIGHDYTVPWTGLNTNLPYGMYYWMAELRNAYYTEIPMLGVGHYKSANCQFFGADQPLALARVASTISMISLSQLQFGFNAQSSTLVADRPNALSCITNAYFLKMFCDSSVQKPVLLFDYGTTNCSAYYRPMNAGAYGVAIFNESPNQTNKTIYFTNLFASPAESYVVQDVWSNANCGTFASSFTYTNIPAQACALLYLTPVPATTYTGTFIGNGSGLTNLPTITSNGITSINPSQIYPAVSANGGNAALATNVVVGMSATNLVLVGTTNLGTFTLGTNSQFIQPTSVEVDLAIGGSGSNKISFFGGGNVPSIQLPNNGFFSAGKFTTYNGTNFIVDTNGNGIIGNIMVTNGNLSASGIISGNGGGLTNLITTNMLFMTSFGNVSIYTNSYWYSLCAPASQSTIENKCSYPSERPFTLVGISIANHANVLVGAGTNLVVTFRTNAASCASATLVGQINPSGSATNIWFAPITIPAGTQINWQLGFSTGSSSGIGFVGCTKLWGWWN